jgi:hypothetical protein
MQWTKTLIQGRKSAVSRLKDKISTVISVSVIMGINIHVHETVSGVLARQAKVNFHVIRGINVARSQPFVADIVGIHTEFYLKKPDFSSKP